MDSYRTQADRLLGSVITDVDGNVEDRSDAISVFNGPPPEIRSSQSESEEIEIVGDWIANLTSAGVLPHEFGIFVRSEAQLDRARRAVERAGLAFKILDDHVETMSGHASLSTMHLAKGLEFRAVVVLACDDEVIPLQERIEHRQLGNLHRLANCLAIDMMVAARIMHLTWLGRTCPICPEAPASCCFMAAFHDTSVT